jgi:hypothetical protein
MKHLILLWWYPRKQSTAIPYYENSYDTLGNKAQQYHTMRTVMIPSVTKHSNTILWEQLWYPRKQRTAIPYYENSYDTLGNKAQQYHTMRTVICCMLLSYIQFLFGLSFLVLVWMLLALVVCLKFYPLFAVIKSKNRLIEPIIGLCYTTYL